MHTPRSSTRARTRRLPLALLATLTASAALFAAQPAVARVADPYTQGQSRMDQADPFTQGQQQTNKADLFTQGADRQADTYGYLSWRGDRFDPYTQGTNQPRSDARGVLAWHRDSSYPTDPQSSRA